MKRFVWLAFPLLLALVAGCGSSGAGKSDVASVAEKFYSALSDDPPTAYTYLSDNCRSKIEYLGFVATINSYHGFVGQGKLQVKNVKIVEQTHNRITADYDVVLKSGNEEIPLTGQVDLKGPSRFVKEHGRWRFEDCAGFPSDGSTPPDNGTPQAGATPTFEPDSPAAIEAEDDPSLPGDFVDLQRIYGGYWGNQDGPSTAHHLQQAIDYSVQGELPPAGGPHWGSGACSADPEASAMFCGPVPWGIYEQPYAAESVVHNMEHAGVVVWYNTSDDALIADLEDLIAANLDDGRFIVMMPYPTMESETIALTAWARRDKFSVDDYSDGRVQSFIDELECRFDPEQLCASGPTPTPLSSSNA